MEDEEILASLPEAIDFVDCRYDDYMLTGSLALYLQGIDVEVNDIDFLLVNKGLDSSYPVYKYLLGDLTIDVITDPLKLKYSFENIKNSYTKSKVLTLGDKSLHLAPLELMALSYEDRGEEKDQEKISKISTHPSFDKEFYKELRKIRNDN